jgi:Tol biopolymer transport system component
MDQFVFDRRDHRTIMASVSSSGRPGNDTSCDATISRGGRYVAFISIATNLVPQRTHGWRSVMVRDLVAGTTTLVSVADDGRPGNHASADPRVSEDGRFVAFRSEASNLIAGDGNRRTDVFLRGPFR